MKCTGVRDNQIHVSVCWLLVNGCRSAQTFALSAELLVSSGVSCSENSFIVIFAVNGTPHLATGTAGLPCTTVISGTERVTTLPAVTTAPRPMVTLANMIAPGPINASLSI